MKKILYFSILVSLILLSIAAVSAEDNSIILGDENAVDELKGIESVELLDSETYDGRHPRGQAAIVRRLQLVRDHQICSMEEAVRRITGGPAETFHLERQGFIKEGYDANITVFNYEKLCANATYQQPYKDNDGIHYVLVNGQIAVSDGKVTGTIAGKVLKWQK